MAGRGAWPNSGEGGTFKYKSETEPGPYYYVGSGLKNTTANERAVHGAVKAYQRALNRSIDAGLRINGVFGLAMFNAVMKFQTVKSIPDTTPWGGIGPDTSKALLYPTLRQVYRKEPHHEDVTHIMISGIINTESMWDAGAVGFSDERDVGLGQINAAAHPEMTEEMRLLPVTSFRFIMGYLSNAFKNFPDDQDAAIASYNLGPAGARAWVRAGKPDMWQPEGSTSERNVRAYIDKILAG